MSKFAMTFPGQGSQSIGMLADLAESFVSVRHTFEEGADTLGIDLWSLAQQGPVEQLNQTHNTQPAMLAAGVSLWRVWNEQGGRAPAVLAGHSLGEYSAMVASGALDYADAIKLVAERGRLMQQAVPQGEGAMAAILGLDDDQVRSVCAEAAQGEVAAAVNFNSPGQVVIAGNASAIARAAELAKAAGAKRALMLDVSVPSHCALMHGAADALGQLMSEMTFGAPAIPVIQNVNVAASSDPDQIRRLLKEQLYSPVRWVETVQAIAALDCELLIEAGPGKVLTGLCKRIDKTLTALAVFDGASLQTAMEAANG